MHLTLQFELKNIQKRAFSGHTHTRTFIPISNHQNKRVQKNYPGQSETANIIWIKKSQDFKETQKTKSQSCLFIYKYILQQ